jgi:hypothetical protein
MVILDMVNKTSNGFGFVKRAEAQKAVDSLNEI